MCEEFSNKKEGNGDTARTSSLGRFPDSRNQGHYRGVGRG